MVIGMVCGIIKVTICYFPVSNIKENFINKTSNAIKI